MVRLSHPYTTTRKTIALSIRTLVGKVISLLFNLLSRFVTAFLPRGKCLLILWLQSLSAVILESKKRKCATLNMPANLESSAVATGLVKVNFLYYEENQKHLFRNMKLGKVLHLFNLLLSNSTLPHLALCPYRLRCIEILWLLTGFGPWQPPSRDRREIDSSWSSHPSSSPLNHDWLSFLLSTSWKLISPISLTRFSPHVFRKCQGLPAPATPGWHPLACW